MNSETTDLIFYLGAGEVRSGQRAMTFRRLEAPTLEEAIVDAELWIAQTSHDIVSLEIHQVNERYPLDVEEIRSRKDQIMQRMAERWERREYERLKAKFEHASLAEAASLHEDDHGGGPE